MKSVLFMGFVSHELVISFNNTFRPQTCWSSSAMVMLAGRGVGRPPCLIGEAPLQVLIPV